MNEHIKFRAYIPENPEGSRMQEVTPEAYAKWFRHYKFMRDTGLKDKNGVRIHTSDIVKYERFNKQMVKEVKLEEYSDSECYAVDKHFGFTAGTTLPDAICYGLEIIGNIMEHPNLLT